ncbi:hypothetical protein P167DRAFT_555515 [Morchella conica CCBAS932]|uniref:ARM repeat-containing protein n=1 Tax=Morchella conica CCBAS932 TaxID=1392247 RepID=A0A3N4KEZ1_9PEZI|nr:hypothetical protein P167DRAFT_555515 [Morchella conica CCBAS932]
MARSSRPPPEEDEDEQQPSNVLQFSDALSWKAGKPIPTGTLITRLKALSKELIALEQEAVDRESLATPARELVNVGLLQHKDPGVKAYAACCLADMLRLHAPDAPYTAVQLKDIFELFVRQLRGLADPETPYYQQHLYLLESLASVKSVVLISDIPNSEAITLKIFTNFFDLARPDGPKNVEYQMTDILVQLIEECNSLPSEVVDIIVAQFFRANPAALAAITARGKPAVKEMKGKKDDGQTKLIAPVPPPAYNMAKAICNQCVDKMARQICQYFSEVIMDASPSARPRNKGGRHTSMSPDSDSDDPALHEPSHEDLQELHKAHLLVKELWKACPAVLQNVIPQLEQELMAENAEIRVLSTETIGDMALTGTFGANAPATWKAWIGRANDKSSAVRAKWVEAAVRIMKERNDFMAVQLVDLVAVKLNDLDDRVRLSACVSLGELDYASITTKLGADLSPFNTYNPELASGAPVAAAATAGRGKGKSADGDGKGWGKRILHHLGERVRDKKFSVRWEGMFCLARMWNMAYADIAAGNEIVTAQLGWIPSKILDTFYINDAEVNVLLDHVLFGVLLPVNYPPIEKESKLVVSAGENGGGSSSRKGKEKEAEKEREREIAEGDKIRVMRLLVLVKGLDVKAKKALFAVPLRQISYAKVMDVFLKSCEDYNGGVMDKDVEEEGVKRALNKFIEWLSQKLPDTPKAKENLLKFAKLHDRRCYQLIRFCFSPDSDYRTVVKALKEIKKRISEAPGTAPTIMETLTPLLYRVSQLIYNKSHVPHIVEFSRTDEASLSAVAHEVLKEMSSSNPAVFKANVKALSDLLQEQSSARSPTDSAGAVDTLKACAGFAKSYPADMPQERKLLQALVGFALTGQPPAAAKHAVSILMYSAKRRDMYAADLIRRCVRDFEFGGEHFLAKLACLAQLVLLAPAQCEEENDAIMDIAKDVLLKAVLKMLMQLVVKEGELSIDEDTPRAHKSRLRLSAALSILKLASSKIYDDLITPTDFNRLACVIQDHCTEVRARFVDKVKKYLASSRLGNRFYTIIFLMAYEPVPEMRDAAVTWVKARTASMRKANAAGNVMEAVFARLLSLLAHHPDFGTQVEDLADFAKYILFYLTAVASEENVSLIYHVAQRVKQFRDGLSPNNSENLYYLSELAQAVIRRYAEHHHWTIQTWPGKIRLPAGLFMPMQSAEQSLEVSRSTYLPEEIELRLDALIKPKSARHGGAHGAGGKKRKSDPNAPRGTASTPAKKKYKAAAATPAGESAEKRKVGRPPKTPKQAPSDAERRRSGRSTTKVKYVEDDDDEEETVEAESDEDSDVEMGDAGSDGAADDEEEEEDAAAAVKTRKEKPAPAKRGRKPRGERILDEEEAAASATPVRGKKAKATTAAVEPMQEDAAEAEKEAEKDAEPEKEPETEEADAPAPSSPQKKITPMKRGRGRPKRGGAAASSPEPTATVVVAERKPARGGRKTRASGTVTVAAVNGTNGSAGAGAAAAAAAAVEHEDSSELSEPPSDGE